MPRALITTVPFADRNRLPLDLLERAGIDYTINPLGRKLAEAELADLVGGFDVLIAGTEPITDVVLERARKLRLISRVGIGLDAVDLLSARRRGIDVSYTPDAPAPAVAELTLGLIFSLLRHVHVANAQMHRGEWRRHFGRRITEVTVGVIGAGRIGGSVLRHLARIGGRRLLVNDLQRGPDTVDGVRLEWTDKDTIYREADVITLHLPLTPDTRDMIRYEQLKGMKADAVLVNTSRGGIVNEQDLARVLRESHLAGAAIDVFEKEPYCGELAGIDRCLLTSHMGSMSVDCRSRMEIEATEEVVRFFAGQPRLGAVPMSEYETRANGRQVT